LQRKLKLVEEINEENEKDIEKLKKDKSKLERENDSLQRLLEQRKLGDENDQDLRKAQKGNDKIKRELDLMHTQLKLTCQEIIQLKKLLAEKDDRYDKLKASLDVHTANLNSGSMEENTNIRSLRTKIISLEAECDTFRLKNSSLEVECSSLKDKVDKLSSQLTRRDEELSTRSEEFTKLEKEHMELKQVTDQLADELLDHDRLKKDVDFDIKLQSLEKERKKLEQSKKTLEEEALTMKRVLVERESASLNIEKKLANVEKELENTKKKFEQDRNALEEEKKQLSTALASWKKKCDELTSMLFSLREEKDILIAQQADTVAKLSQTTKLAHETVKELSVRTAETLEELQKKLSARVAKLNKQLEASNNKIESQKEEIRHLRGVWRSLLVSHPDLDMVGETSIEELRMSMQEKQQLEKENQEQRDEIESLVVMVAMQHLRLLIARWRQPMFRERFKLQQEASVRAQIIDDNREEGVVVLDGNDMAARKMILSIQEEQTKKLQDNPSMLTEINCQVVYDKCGAALEQVDPARAAPRLLAAPARQGGMSNGSLVGSDGYPTQAKVHAEGLTREERLVKERHGHAVHVRPI